MLKVLHIGKFYPPVPGGIERVVQSLCEVTKGRLESEVLAFNTTSTTVRETVGGIPVTRVATWGSAGSVPVAPSFFAHLRRARADVMILHEPNPWALLSMAVVRTRIPMAIWFHSEVVRPKLQYDLFYAPIARPVYKEARRFVVSSPMLGEQAESLQPFRDRIAVVPFGIDVERWQPTEAICRRAAEIRVQAGRPIVLFAGRHVPYKGVPVLIEAASALDVHVSVLGDGPMRSAWTELAARQQGAATFQFHDEVDDLEMRAQIAASRMLVLPSVTRAETFGFVQLEAMATGTPVISTLLPTGVPWVNESGIVVPPNDAGALRTAIARLVDDAALAQTIGAAGRARACSEFSLAGMRDRIVQVCEDVAREGGSGRPWRS